MSEIIQAFPLFAIICCFVGAVLSSFLNHKQGFYISLIVCLASIVLNSFVLAYVLESGESIIYTMGHFGPKQGHPYISCLTTNINPPGPSHHLIPNIA